MKIFRSFFRKNSALNNLYIFDNFLSKNKCNEILDHLSKLSFNKAKQINVGRHNQEIFIDDIELENVIKSKIDSYKFKNLNILDISLPLEFYRYDAGDFITSHTDAARKLKDNLDSNFTAIIYLNDTFQGGETRFISLDRNVTPKQGTLLLFKHHLEHEALKVVAGNKYIYRANWLLTS